MNVNWSIEDDEKLIDFVQKHEVLYNIKNKEYRQTHLKGKLWCEVGEIVNKPGPDCHKRWCYVRDYYIRRKRNPGGGSTGEAARKRSRLLTFLDDFSCPQRSSIIDVKVDIPLENTLDHNEDSFQKYEDMTLSIEDDEDCQGESEDDKDILKKIKITHSQEHLNFPEPQRQGLIPSSQNDLDETDLFFNSMAKIVKKLPRHEQIKIRMQIATLVGNAELRSIDPINTSPKPSTSDSN